jgi:hypothetical protein
MSKHNKKIVLTNTYLPNITNVDSIKTETQDVIKNLYERFMNETNCNNYEKCTEALESYRYIRNNWIVPNARYIRYIDTHDAKNMVLKKGGFVMDCNKYIFSLYDKKYGQFIIDKRDRIFFMKLNSDDINRCNLENFLR